MERTTTITTLCIMNVCYIARNINLFKKKVLVIEMYRYADN